MRRMTTLLAVCGALAAAGPALAQSYPTRPITLVVPFAPGGSASTAARSVADKMSETLGQQIVIDNRGGANGIIGAELAANAPADGYTLLMVSTSWVMNAAIRDLPYDVEKSYDPVTTIGSSPNSIVVNPGGPYRVLRDLVEAAKSMRRNDERTRFVGGAGQLLPGWICRRDAPAVPISR